MPKDLHKALKTKLKVANFMEKTKVQEHRRSSSQKEGADLDGGDTSGSDVEILETDQTVTVSDQTTVSSSSVNTNTMEEEDLLEVMSEDDEHDFEETQGPPSIPPMRMCLNGIRYRKLDSNSLLVSLEPFRKLFLAGKLFIQVVKGTVDVYGFNIAADGNRYKMFSAKGHSSLVCIKALSRGSEVNFEHPQMSREEILTREGTLVILEGFENEWCDGIRQLYPNSERHIGPSMTGIGPRRTPKKKLLMEKLGFHFVEENSNKFKLLEFPQYFDNIFSDLTKEFDCLNGRMYIYGGKGVGKSTFVRWLTNRLLSYDRKRKESKVLVLDLDPGQTEFTPAGMISVHVCTEPLLGPNFTHLKLPSRAVFLGATSVADFPVSYIKGVVDLFEYCSTHTEFNDIPWIVNTMGFSQGLGVDFACEIIKIVRPTIVIQLEINNDKRSFPFPLNKENVELHKTFLSTTATQKYQDPLRDYIFLSVRSVCNIEETTNRNVWGASPKSLRELVMISYFAEKAGGAEGFTLQSIVPLCVPLDVVAIGTMSSNLSYGEILDAINGNLVALCEMEESHFKTEENSARKFITQAGDYINNCIGYGIVRSIDKESQTLYVITPINENDVLLKVNVILSAGNVGMPVHLYVQQTSSKNVTDKPYIMNRKEGTSTLHSATKKHFSQKRVTHNVLKNCLL